MDHRIWAANVISTTLSREPMVAAWNEVPAVPGASSECAALVASAEHVRSSAPELAAQFARRALTMAAMEPGGAIQPRARALLADALVRLGRPADAVEPAIVGLHAAEAAGAVELAAGIRIDLAACSREVGEPLIGCAILAPVLEVPTGRPAERAVAIAQLVECAAHVGRRDDLEDALDEADRLLAADDGLSADARRIERARLCVRRAAYHRRYGDTEDAIESARDGLGLLTRLRDARLEGGQVRARLVHELVCSLLDEGQLAEAEEAATPVLAQPARATAAPAVGRLMLAVATRVDLPAGRVAPGRRLLADAVWLAERYGLDWLLADALTTIAHLEERAANLADALYTLRAAHAAEHRQLRAVGLAKRLLMTEFGMEASLPEAVHALLRNVLGPPTMGRLPVAPPEPESSAPPAGDRAEAADTDAATGLLNRAALYRRLAAVRGGERPVALTLVRLDQANRDAGDQPAANVGTAGAGSASAGPVADDQLAELASRVRNLAPRGAEIARSDGTEFAVLLPHTTRDEAEEFAAAIRADTRDQDMSISTGVAQSEAGPSAGQNADALLAAARSALTPAEPPRPAAGVGAVDDPVAVDWGVNDLPYGRAVLSTLSAQTGDGTAWRPAEGPPADVSVEASAAEASVEASVAEPSDPEAAPAQAAPAAPAEELNGWPRTVDSETLLWQSIPPVPEPEEVPRPAPTPDIPEPPEPEPIPPARPEPGPIPPGEPPAEPPPPSPLPQPEEPTAGDTPAPVLGPVQGPAPRPDDDPRARPDDDPRARPEDDPRARSERTSGRRGRAASETLADLLAGALAAYQSTEQRHQTEHSRAADTPRYPRTASRAGRHRSPDWATLDPDAG